MSQVECVLRVQRPLCAMPLLPTLLDVACDKVRAQASAAVSAMVARCELVWSSSNNNPYIHCRHSTVSHRQCSCDTYHTARHWRCRRRAASGRDWTGSGPSARCPRSRVAGSAWSAHHHYVLTAVTAGPGSPGSSDRCVEMHRYYKHIQTGPYASLHLTPDR